MGRFNSFMAARLAPTAPSAGNKVIDSSLLNKKKKKPMKTTASPLVKAFGK